MAEVFYERDECPPDDRSGILGGSKLSPFPKPPYVLLLSLFTAAFFIVVGADYTSSLGRKNLLNEQTLFSNEFRRHRLSEREITKMRELPAEKRGEAAGIYILNHWNGQRTPNNATPFSPSSLFAGNTEQMWKDRPAWENFHKACEAIWNDVVYFPVPVSDTHKDYTVSYVDSWLSQRTFGGKRGHEGTDLMASEDRPGLYPVVSMTDGTVASKGWLPKGGYRLGILSPSGGYFYYAHLDSYAALEEGDRVSAGDILGFMGDSGYGPEGTTGMFATHLHVGIYIYPREKETSINPYWILRMIEEKKLSCSF